MSPLGGYHTHTPEPWEMRLWRWLVALLLLALVLLELRH
jgi:hypothetical protein